MLLAHATSGARIDARAPCMGKGSVWTTSHGCFEIFVEVCFQSKKRPSPGRPSALLADYSVLHDQERAGNSVFSMCRFRFEASLRMHFFGTLISECLNPSSCRLRKDELHDAYHASSHPGIGQKNCKRIGGSVDYASNPGTVGMMFEAAVMYGDRHAGDNDALESLDQLMYCLHLLSCIFGCNSVCHCNGCLPTCFKLSQIVPDSRSAFMTSYRVSHRFTTFGLLHQSTMPYQVSQHSHEVSQHFKTFYKVYCIISSLSGRCILSHIHSLFCTASETWLLSRRKSPGSTATQLWRMNANASIIVCEKGLYERETLSSQLF